MILLLAQRDHRSGRIDPLKVGAKRLDPLKVGAKRLDKASELISRQFSNILMRFFSWARVEK
jgi:hypothetical protein